MSTSPTKAARPKKITGAQAVKFNALFGKVQQLVRRRLRVVSDHHEGEAEMLDDGKVIERKFEIASGDLTLVITMTATRND